jgi:uncharacterized protein
MPANAPAFHGSAAMSSVWSQAASVHGASFRKPGRESWTIMEMNSSKDVGDRLFFTYVTLFVAVWTIYVLLLYPHVQALGDGALAYAVVNIAVRLLIWVLPVFAYLRIVGQAKPLHYLRLVHHWRRGVLVGTGLAVAILAIRMVRLGVPQVSWSAITWNSVLSTSFGIGFFEEIPFRGLILQKLAARMSFWPANGICSAVFVGLHLPGWMSLHLFSWPQALNVFLLSFVFGATLLLAKSLWACIIAHDANDFIAFILFHGR